MNVSGKNRRMGRSIPGFLSIFVLFAGINFSFGQERFIMDENTFQKFKLARRLYTKGEMLFQKENHKKAEKELKECIKIFPQYAEAYFFLSQIYYQENDMARAQKNIELAKSNYKSMADIRVATQLQYFDKLRGQKQSLEESLRDLKEALSQAKTDSQKSIIESSIAKVNVQINQINARVHSEIPSADQVPAEYYYCHGNIFFKMKKFKEAHQQYLETVKIDPGHGNAYNNLANLYYMIKKYDRALNYLNRAEANGVSINPKFKEAVIKALASEN